MLGKAEERMRGKAKELEALKGEFKARLQNVETPFGWLPVGLNEAVLAFPVLLALVFLVSAAQLAEATRLRTALARYVNRVGEASTGSAAAEGERLD